MDLRVIFGPKKLKNFFCFCFGCSNGTGHTSQGDVILLNFIDLHKFLPLGYHISLLKVETPSKTKK